MSVQNEFAYARSQGWLEAFAGAGARYGFTPALLMAIASRETNMRNIIGDRGHGYGLMQIDAGTDPEFCHSGQWRNAALGISRGANILAQKRDQIEHLVGRSCLVGGYHFIGKAGAPIAVTIAAYNCGLWAYYNFSCGRNPDTSTTGHNYSRDVLGRMAQFAELLK